MRDHLPDDRVLNDDGTTRPYVKTDISRPLVAERLKRHLHQVREAVREDRESACATCPAAQLLGVSADGLTVRCGVERSLVTEEGSPGTLARFCLHDYIACPTWRREKERIWAQRKPEVAEHEGV